MGLTPWYAAHGRHDLSWRRTRDRWAVLVSEVMLHQTQVSRVAEMWPAFLERFPTPEAMAAAGPGAVIEAWGRLGYPRRARRLFDSATTIAATGWPEDLETLPGVGRYTARAVECQVDGADVSAVEVNIRRVVERVEGVRLTDREVERAMIGIGAPLRGRDRLLALMDLGALICRPRTPACDECPLAERCATRGALGHEQHRRRQPRYEGSMRQRRGQVLAALRSGPTAISALDDAALRTLVADGLAEDDGDVARLPTS